jgi:hypothetical protein
MDFLHEDPQQEREYIKRLMKHKHSTGKRIFIQLNSNKIKIINNLKKEIIL